MTFYALCDGAGNGAEVNGFYGSSSMFLLILEDFCGSLKMFEEDLSSF
jgi:hypothetical protein